MVMWQLCVLILVNCYGIMILKIYLHCKSDLFMKFLYYENLELYSTYTSSYYRKILMIISYSDMQALPWLFLCIYLLMYYVPMDFMFK